MPDPIITLTTDFGEDSPYVAAMKGVLLAINPEARLVDLSHQIPPQDVRHAAFFLRHAIPYFPPEAIHLVVVDPGVGTERALLHVRVDGRRLVVPDNGCWTWLPCTDPAARTVLRLTEPSFWRQPVSSTFHGRDILAPVAGHLSRGVEPGKLGVPAADWVRLEVPRPVLQPGLFRGEVIFVDRFGNLITNLPGDAFRALPGAPRLQVDVGSATHRPLWVKSYAAAEPGAVVALISSGETFELAVNQGNAALLLQAGPGTPVTVRWEP